MCHSMCVIIYVTFFQLRVCVCVCVCVCECVCVWVCVCVCVCVFKQRHLRTPTLQALLVCYNGTVYIDNLMWTTAKQKSHKMQVQPCAIFPNITNTENVINLYQYQNVF